MYVKILRLTKWSFDKFYSTTISLFVIDNSMCKYIMLWIFANLLYSLSMLLLVVVLHYLQFDYNVDQCMSMSIVKRD